MKDYVIHKCELVPYEGYSLVEVFRTNSKDVAIQKLEELSNPNPMPGDMLEDSYLLQIEHTIINIK